VSAGRSGDLIAIHNLLRTIFRGPSAAEFQAQQDAPGSDPSQRFVARARHEVIAHVRVGTVGPMQYGNVAIPSAWLMDLATAAQYRGQGLATELIIAAERDALRRGATLLFARSSEIEFLTRRGWRVCGRHSFSLVDACRLIAVIAERSEEQPSSLSLLKRDVPPRAWHVRPFRLLDMPELMRLEKIRTSGKFGAVARDQETWDWLLTRRAFDQIYVVTRGTSSSALAGYAVACGSRVAEMVIDPALKTAAGPLLSHVAREALEAGTTSLRFDGPPDDPHHEWCVAAKGRKMHEVLSGGEAYLVKVLDPRALLEQTAPVWQANAAEAGDRSGMLALEFEHSQAGVAPSTLVLNPSNGSVSDGPDRVRKTRLQLPLAQLGPLVLGQATHEGNERALSLAAVHARGAALAATLFPPLPLYYPSLDHLTAR
jgi:GNAT superfamily N-acetyltransferase